MLVSLVEQISELDLWDDVRWHDTYTKFHDDPFSQSSNIQVMYDLKNLRGCIVGVRNWEDL
jgi:hypothetical protein